jgi:hypothetical protein
VESATRWRARSLLWRTAPARANSQALFTNPSIVLDQDLGPNLYMAGDHNGLGMEPAAISGIYAANRILGVA